MPSSFGLKILGKNCKNETQNFQQLFWEFQNNQKGTMRGKRI